MLDEVLRVRVYGWPVNQGRPRVTRTGHVYQPDDLIAWRRTVAVQAKMARLADWPVLGPLALRLAFYLERPKSRPASRRQHDSIPDLDNLTKAVLDALTKIVWRDDAQLCKLDASKQYGPEPGVAVLVRRVGQEEALA